MNLSLILFAVRLASAALLLALLALMVWLIYREMRTAVVAAPLASPPEAMLQARLTVVGDGGTPPLTGSTFPLAAVTTIGRSSQNTVALNDSFASGSHARISRREQQWWLEDLQSRNGTLLNDVPVAGKAVLTSGDVITIGNTRFQFHA